MGSSSGAAIPRAFQRALRLTATVAAVALSAVAGRASAQQGASGGTEASLPLTDRDKQAAWRGQLVWQRAGGTFNEDGVAKGVFVTEDPDNRVRKRCWVLNEGAVGIVENVEVVEGRDFVQLDVRFKGSLDDPKRLPIGWTEARPEFTNRKVTTSQSETTVSESYGGSLQVNTDSQSVTKDQDGLPIDGDVGHVIEHGDDSFLVRYSTDRPLERRRPRVGERVVRGPDWRGGTADGCLRPWGQHPESESGATPPFTGEVISEGADANGLLVRWDRTGRVTAHRFNVSRYYDVQVVPDVKPPNDVPADPDRVGQ